MTVRPQGIKDLIEFDNEAKALKGFRFLFGVDEAGRGPLAGPVTAAAVLLRAYDFSVPVRDSKTLNHSQRLKAYHEIYERARVGVGIVNEAVIDEVNILRAAHMAMALAVRDLVSRLPSDVRHAPGFDASVRVLIDGNLFTAHIPYAVTTVVKGDARSLSVACAGIVAKVTRDRMIDIYDSVYPQYGFRRHKGYPTPAHREAIRIHGLCPIHRRSFRSL
jgi:ribonuclease HII